MPHGPVSDEIQQVMAAWPRESVRVAAAVAASPQAAAVAVQVLRAVEQRPVADGLIIESLAYAVLQGSGDHARWLAGQGSVAPGSPGSLHLHRDGAALSVLIDRPDSLNAIDRPMRDALYDAFTLASLDEEITSVTLRSVGKAFCIGAEQGEFGTTRDPATAHLIRMRTLPAQALIGSRAKLRVHVQGACVGAGLEMAAFANRVTASPRAWFQLPELAMGLIPGAGGCVSVSRRIGWQRAAAMILSGARIRAETALTWGLIDAIMDD